MMKTYDIPLFFILFTFSICNLASSQLKEYYLEDLCGNWNSAQLNIKYTRSGILKSSNDHTIDCSLELIPEDGYSIVLSISRYTLNRDDTLTITDADDVIVVLGGKRDYFDQLKSFTSNGRMFIHLAAANSTSYDGFLKFEFTYTAVHDGQCSFEEFQCRNLNCIPSFYTCDYHNHCGDNSNNADSICTTVTTHNPVTSNPVVVKETHEVLIFPIIIIVGIAVILIIVIPLIVYGVKKMKQKPKSQAVIPGAVSQAPTAPAQQIPTASISQLPTVLVLQNPTAPAPTYAAPSAFARLRQSFKRSKPASQPPTAVDAKEMENYQVPSMYPQIPDALKQEGIENPDFKIEE